MDRTSLEGHGTRFTGLFRFPICFSVSKLERYKSDCVQNLGQISQFLIPCKIREEMGDESERVFRQSTAKILMTKQFFLARFAGGGRYCLS